MPGLLGKFALRLCENLILQGVQADISKVSDDSADINHHIIYAGYYGYAGKKNTTETVMVTHIDTELKLNMVREQLKVSRWAYACHLTLCANLPGLVFPGTGSVT